MNRIILSCFTILLLIISCSSPPAEDVVATVGSERISFAEVEKSRWLNPQYMNRAPLRTVREAQLNHLVDERFYYLAAKEAGLADSSDLQRKFKYIHDREVIAAFIEGKFVEETSLNDIELIQAYAKYQREIHLKHLFVKELKMAENLYQRLKSGELFDVLAQEVFKDEYLKQNGGDLGYVCFGKTDREIENKMYQMQPGEISKPVKSAYGYHILQVVDIRENEKAKTSPAPMVSELLRKTLKNRKIDQKIRTYLKETVGDQKIQINNRIVDVLLGRTQAVMHDKFNSGDVFAVPMNNNEIRNIGTGIKGVANKEVLKFANTNFTVSDFLNRLKEMPPYHRPYLNGRQRIMQAMIDMIRNDLILADAEKAGISKEAAVNQKIYAEQKQLMINEFKQRYNSADYRKNREGAWQKLAHIYKSIRQKYSAEIDSSKLILKSENPDSMLEKPIPMFFKNRYSW